MEKKNFNWKLPLIILFAIVAVVCAVFLIITANKLMFEGSTPLRIGGVVGLSICFIISVAFMGVLFSLNNYDKAKELIKYDDPPQKEEINEQEKM